MNDQNYERCENSKKVTPRSSMIDTPSLYQSHTNYNIDKYNDYKKQWKYIQWFKIKCFFSILFMYYIYIYIYMNHSQFFDSNRKQMLISCFLYSLWIYRICIFIFFFFSLSLYIFTILDFVVIIWIHFNVLTLCLFGILIFLSFFFNLMNQFIVCIFLF